jgi:ubiquinone/menaquinone biosynthesis C-methylase UbiE
MNTGTRMSSPITSAPILQPGAIFALTTHGILINLHLKKYVIIVSQGSAKLSHTNAWANPSNAGAGDAIRMASYLEERSSTPDTQQVNQKFCQVIAPHPGERLLEVGSGSGVICRLLAPSLQPGGSMLGVDISPVMTAESRRYALAAGIDRGLIFETASADALPYPDSSFDGALAARLLLHAGNPDAVIGEMARVVKPGGRIVVMDWDFETVTVDHPDRRLTRRIINWRSDHHGGDNWSGRQLWRRMRLAGLGNLSIHTFVTVSTGKASALNQSLWRAAQVACDGGAITPAEQSAWTYELEARLQAGTFFASIVYFIVMGTVEADQKGGEA